LFKPLRRCLNTKITSARPSKVKLRIRNVFPIQEYIVTSIIICILVHPLWVPENHGISADSHPLSPPRVLSNKVWELTAAHRCPCMTRMPKPRAVDLPSPLHCFCSSAQSLKYFTWPVSYVHLLVLHPPIGCPWILHR